MADSDEDSIWGEQKPQFQDDGVHAFLHQKLTIKPVPVQRLGLPDYQGVIKTITQSEKLSPYSFAKFTGSCNDDKTKQTYKQPEVSKPTSASYNKNEKDHLNDLMKMDNKP